MGSPRFAVLGAGGVGGYFAAVLARAGYWVGLVARGPHLLAIRQNGLQVESPKGAFRTVPAQVTDDPAQIGPVDAVILAVKAWQVEAAAGAARPLLGPATKVLPLQNGVEAPSQLHEILGPQHVLIGLCRIISSVAGPGCIRHAGLEPTIVLGEPDDSPLSPSARVLAEALIAAGVVVQTPRSIRAALWEKLLFITAVSGVGAVTRATIGEVRACPPVRHLLRRVMEEVAAVAAAQDIPLEPEAVLRTLAFVDTMPESATASMQRDIVAGRPSELEAIVGAVVRFGEKLAVPTPVTQYLYASLLPQERRARDSGAT